MLLARVGASLLLTVQICCSKWAFSFSSRSMLGIISCPLCLQRLGWCGSAAWSLTLVPSGRAQARMLVGMELTALISLFIL